MRTSRIATILSILVLAAAAPPPGAAAGETPWFDLENCAMCKNMSSEQGLIEHMEWENHLTSDGMMAVTVVAAGYEEGFQRAMANMQATGQRLMAGEKMNLCGYCQSHGALMMAGAQFEYFETGAGHINLVTSRDPAVVEKIHVHGQRTIDELAKMTAAAEHEHLGHDH